jgi:hypothetical protein
MLSCSRIIISHPAATIILFEVHSTCTCNLFLLLICCDLSCAPADALSSSSSEFGSSAKDAAFGLKDKVKSVIKDATSALPNSIATVADQNADVRGLAQNYRDPAGAIQQDKATGEW